MSSTHVPHCIHKYSFYDFKDEIGILIQIIFMIRARQSAKILIYNCTEAESTRCYQLLFRIYIDRVKPVKLRNKCAHQAFRVVIPFHAGLLTQSSI